MSCNTYQTEIEELSGAKALSAKSLRHLEKCSECRRFNLEREHLRQILQTLPQVEAPNDFNFRLKSRLRKTEQATLSSSRKMVWLTSSAAALCLVVILTFVLARRTSPVTQPETNFVATQIKSEPSPDAVRNEASSLPTVETAQPVKSPSNPVAVQTPANIVARRKIVTNPSSSRKALPKNEIYSITSSVSPPKPSIIAGGFNDPLAPPKKQTAAGLLRTVGIETENKAEGLSVVSVSPIGQAGRSDLQPGDIIQKVNGENPLAISGNEFKEFKLTVRRKNQTQEIIISAKPQD